MNLPKRIERPGICRWPRGLVVWREQLVGQRQCRRVRCVARSVGTVRLPAEVHSVRRRYAESRGQRPAERQTRCRPGWPPTTGARSCPRGSEGRYRSRRRCTPRPDPTSPVMHRGSSSGGARY